VTEVGRDADLLELQLQNRATWDTLEAAARQRDAVVRYHGAVVALLPVLLGRMTVGQFLAVTATAVVFLAFVSGLAVVAVQSLRVLQFRISAAERCSRHRLAVGHPQPYFGYTAFEDLPPLRLQRDPMGFVVASARLLLLLDVLLLPLVGAIVLAYVIAGDGLLGWPLALALAAGATGGIAVTLVVRARVDRALRTGEHEVSTEVRERLRSLGVGSAVP
jgi:hypothetical protein